MHIRGRLVGNILHQRPFSSYALAIVTPILDRFAFQHNNLRRQGLTAQGTPGALRPWKETGVHRARTRVEPFKEVRLYGPIGAATGKDTGPAPNMDVAREAKGLASRALMDSTFRSPSF